MPLTLYHIPRYCMAADDPLPPIDVARAKRDAIHELRGVAGAVAADLGHQLGGWHEAAAEEEVAYCRRCRCAVYVTVVREPHLEGPAVTQRCHRPDAFLAHQSAADIAAAIEGAAGRFFPAIEWPEGSR